MKAASVIALIAILLLWVVFPPGYSNTEKVRVLDIDRSVSLAPLRTIAPDRIAADRIAAIEAQALPASSYRYRRAIIAAAHKAFGLRAPVALLAAQIRAESAYREAARSHAGAQGIAQFMPATARLMAVRYPELAPAQPDNPAWAFLAQAYHMRDLHALYPAASNSCERWAFALSAYNGGPRALERERAMAADPSRWFNQTEQKRWRRASAFAENRAYVRTILRRLEPRYARAGWGGGLSCT